MSDTLKLALTFVNKLSEGKKNFDGINLAGAVLEGLTTHEGSSLNRGNFRGCRLVSASMNGLSLKATIFDAADMRGAVIVGSNCQRATFQDANLARVNFSKSRLRNANLRQANLKGANLQQTDLRGVDFRGADLSQAEFRGAFYDNDTMFDLGINPSRLGMRNVSVDSTVKDASASPQSKAQPQKKMMYRGSLINVPDDSGTSAQSEKSKVQDAPKKKGLMYRGVEI